MLSIWDGYGKDKTTPAVGIWLLVSAILLNRNKCLLSSGCLHHMLLCRRFF